MIYTVELTDEQATNLLKHGQGDMFTWELALREAVIKQRPQPLKVGDKLFATEATNFWYRVVAFGTLLDGQRWVVGRYRDQGVVTSLAIDRLETENGKAPVWPDADA